MMKRLLIIVAAVGLLVSCPDPANNNSNSPNNPNNPNKPIDPKENTTIVFDNTQGICPVTVFSDYRRRESDITAVITAGGISDEIEWPPGDSVPFYFLYRVNFKDISGFTLNYVPMEIGKDQKAAHIDAGKKTVIAIPKLVETISSTDEMLTNKSYIFIKNNSSNSFSLNLGTAILTPDNSTTSSVNGGQQACYTVNPGSASLYHLQIGADSKALTNSIDRFEAGYVYVFDFNGNVSLVSAIEIKLENVAGLGIGNIGTVTVNAGENGELLINWPAVSGTEQYDVYYSVNTSIPLSPALTVSTNTAAIGGLTNGTTYYVWVKPKNANGTGKASTAASGTPKLYNKPGLYRGEEKIGLQNLAASLSWISANSVTGDDFYIVLGEDESSAPVTLNYSGKTVGITLMGSGGEKTITLSAKGKLFTMNSDVTLTLGENITLQGMSANNNSLVHVNSGKLILNAGAKITGNTTSGNYYNRGGGVYVSMGTFTMNGGTISGNTASSSNSNTGQGGGGVYVDTGGTFIMNGGKITGNTASGSDSVRGYGGGVFIYGDFTMNDGEISGNTASSYKSGFGGGISVLGGTFTMNGGTISGNTASGSSDSGGDSGYGGGVSVLYNNGIFTMNGGDITGNTASGEYGSGGGVEVLYGGNFFMKGGTISCNTATYSGGGVDTYNEGILIKTGGTITGYSDDPVNGNVIKDDDGICDNSGHAVFIDSVPEKRRENTAGPDVNLDSRVDGPAGGWES